MLATEEAYKWLITSYRSGWTKSPHAIIDAVVLTRHSHAFEFLRDIATLEPDIRGHALTAMASLGRVDVVHFFMEQALLWDDKPDAEKVQFTKAQEAYRGDRQEPPKNPFHHLIANAIDVIRDRRALPELRGWSQSPVPEVKRAAIETYARLSQPSERAWMWELMVQANRGFAAIILDALVGVPLDDPVPLLVAFPRDEYGYHYYERDCLDRFLASQIDPRSRPALRELCVKGDWPLRWGAIRALAALANEEDRSLLIAIASDPADQVRRAAIQALTDFKHPESEATLRAIALSGSSDRLEAAAAYSRVAPSVKRADLLQETVRRGLFDIAGILDCGLHAPMWWSEL